VKVFRRTQPESPDARARALARLTVRPPTHARLHTDDVQPEYPEERDEVRGGWIPDQVPDRLRNARWTLTPRHVLVLLAVLALGLTWATWTFLHARPTPIPETHPTTTTPGTPVTQPCPAQPQALHLQPTAQPCSSGPQPSAGPTQPGAAQTQPGAGQTQPGAGQTQPGANQSPGTGSSTSQQVVVVYVAGKVRRPGLVSAPVGSRVADVLALAGGALRGVDLTTLNLARQVTDGEQIIVGQPNQPQPINPPSASTTSGPTTVPNTPVNLNSATLEQLDALPGVGPVLAQRILDYRTQNGPFTTIDQLQEVPGVGPKKFDSLKSHVRI
jgi:competence protein ComEA